MIGAFIIGVVCGACIGYVLACLCIVSRRSQDAADREMQRRIEERGGRR